MRRRPSRPAAPGGRPGRARAWRRRAPGRRRGGPPAGGARGRSPRTSCARRGATWCRAPPRARRPAGTGARTPPKDPRRLLLHRRLARRPRSPRRRGRRGAWPPAGPARRRRRRGGRQRGGRGRRASPRRGPAGGSRCQLPPQGPRFYLGPSSASSSWPCAG
uniref:Uncharacterized protein n=1 Tax=Arundo donax TaxID=35708 RepID=A0A0A9EZ44_ARUDO